MIEHMNKLTRPLRAIALVAAAIIALAGLPQASASETVVGLRLGYNTRSESPTVGLMFQRRFSEHFRLAPNVDYYFRHHGVDALSIDCNVHIPFRLTPSGRSSIYPLAGANYSSWNNRGYLEDHNDVNTRKNRLGLNCGLGYEYYASPSLKISVEAKGIFAISTSSATFSASISYVF